MLQRTFRVAACLIVVSAMSLARDRAQDGRASEPSTAVAGAVAPPPAAPPAPEQACAPARSDLALLATIVAWPAALSMALVDDGREFGGRFVAAGSGLDGATVAAVQRGRVVLRRGDRFECLVPGRRPAAPAPVATAAITVGRAWLRDQLEHLERIASWARVRPRRDAAGHLTGFVLVALRRDSPLARLGVHAGDVLTAIDGRPLDSPNVVLAALDRLPDADRVALEVERAGRRHTLEYRVR